MKINYRAFATVTILFCTSVPALASSDDRLLTLVQSLERRIAALENENREYKRQIDTVRSTKGREPEKSHAAVPGNPMLASARAETSVPRYSWTGLYTGASAGGAITRSRISTNEVLTLLSSSTFGSSTQTNTTLGSAGPKTSSGYFADLFAGANLQISNVVLGSQIEGSLAGVNFDAVGSRTQVTAAPGFPSVGFGVFRPVVDARWMVSALGRAGLLIENETLVYGIGGYTFAEFNARNLTDNTFFMPTERFRIGGWTAGVGIERHLMGNWTIRAEYRYTDFDRHTLKDTSTFTSSGPGFLFVQTANRTNQFDFSMHAARIGLAYAFPIQP